MYSLHECVVFKNGENIQCSKKKGEIHSVESLVFQCGVSQLFVLLVPLGKSSACVHSCQILVAVFECCWAIEDDHMFSARGGLVYHEIEQLKKHLNQQSPIYGVPPADSYIYVDVPLLKSQQGSKLKWDAGA